jgi:hypothetical protein
MNLIKFNNQMADTVVLTKEIPAEADTGDAEEAQEDAPEEETTIVSIRIFFNVSIVAKRATILPTAKSEEKMTMNSQTWYPSQISKTYFNPL